MPELPELEVIKFRLKASLLGKKVNKFKVLKPYVLKNYFAGDLSGEQVKDIMRRGKYLVFMLTSHNVYVHLMRHGSVDYLLPSLKTRKSTTALLVMDDGTRVEFSERTTQKRMSIYIKPKNEALGKIENLGIEPLSEEFTVEALVRILRSDRKQLKSFLCRQSKIAGIGNAYADEILWEAGLSPFKLSSSLNKQETERLHKAIIGVLSRAIKSSGESERLDRKDFLQIHGKKGSPCPRCGGIIRIISFLQSDTYYCPTCQTGGHKLKDRRMSKFYR
jgi:formamidopyrimidine-DNA glycosylase